MFAQLYTAPAAMLDMCDSNGCLPGQIPMAGQKAHSNLDANATTTMDQVSATPCFVLSGQLCRRARQVLTSNTAGNKTRCCQSAVRLVACRSQSGCLLALFAVCWHSFPLARLQQMQCGECVHHACMPVIGFVTLVTVCRCWHWLRLARPSRPRLPSAHEWHDLMYIASHLQCSAAAAVSVNNTACRQHSS